MHIIALLVVCVLLLTQEVVEGKKMWGSRKKREQEEEVVVAPTPPTVFESKRSSRSNRRKFSTASDTGSMDSSKFEEMFNMYLSSFEQLLDSDDFDSMVNPESIRTMMMQFPGASDVPEVKNLMNMPEFNDPELLKATMREGLALAKASTAEVFALLSDPDKVEEMLGQLPPEVKKLIEGLKTGDFTALKDFVINLPGLDATQRRLLISLLDGNTDALAAELQKVLGDDEQVEAARLQFLAAPDLAEAMGISLDLLEDPVRWAEVMKEGADALLAGGGGATKQASAAPGRNMKGQTALMKQLLKSFSEQGRGDPAAGEGEEEKEEEEPVPFSKRRFAGRAA